MKRGQSSFEFVMLASAALVGVSMMIIVAQGMLASAVTDQQQASLGAIQNAIIAELEQADRAPVGYTRTFTLPTSIDGQPYTIIILEDTPPRADALILTWRNTTRLTFLQQDVNGTLNPGTNTIHKTSTLFLNRLS